MPAIVLKVNKNTMKVKFSDDDTVKTMSFDKIWKKKKKMKREYRYSKAADTKLTTKRLSRYRGLITIVGTQFSPYKLMGNFGRMIEQLRDKEGIFNALIVFNDNTLQWEFAGLNPTTQQGPGGGNAVVRPFECIGDSTGMPTGPFPNLKCSYSVQFPHEETPTMHTAKEIIDEQINRMIRIFLKYPNKDTLYYSTESDSDRIGLGIFSGQVGDDVIDYISKRIQEIPPLVQKARVLGIVPGV